MGSDRTKTPGLAIKEEFTKAFFFFFYVYYRLLMNLINLFSFSAYSRSILNFLDSFYPGSTKTGRMIVCDTNCYNTTIPAAYP